jgi:hypothetical protein
VVLRNEDSQHQLDMRWYRAAGFTSYDEAVQAGLSAPRWYEFVPLKDLQLVTIAKIESFATPPLVAVVVDAALLRLSTKAKLLELDQPMVLDPVHKDFSLKLLEDVVRGIGGKK